MNTELSEGRHDRAVASDSRHRVKVWRHDNHSVVGVGPTTVLVTVVDEEQVGRGEGSLQGGAQLLGYLGCAAH